MNISSAKCIALAALFLSLSAAYAGEAAQHEFAAEFDPAPGWVKAPEKSWRADVCLNGRWQFQPVAVPAGYQRNRGVPPELPLPAAGAWETAPVKVPSPWNVNAWGGGRDVGAGTARPYWPGSLYYPSYPARWDSVEMGWLRRTFRVPGEWDGRRIVLHFEAVAGECQVWVNGKLAGRHFDKYLPFDLDITSLVKPGEENELLVGVRAHALFNRQSERYSKMRAPYPSGSETERLVGIWQDVFLLGLPPVRVQDVYVQPLVDQDALELPVTIRNDTEREQRVRIGAQIHPWINRAGSSIIEAPEPRWELGAGVLEMLGDDILIAAGEARTITLHHRVAGRLKLWSPDAPNLYAAALSVQQDGRTIDTHLTRFGWRQFTINGRELLLNGQRIQLVGDLLHPFGPNTMSRRHVWAWYRMIRDMGGNAVRPHAQIHPRCYMELADEMGLVVLDESALFGSSIALNFDAPEAWQRFAEHVDCMVLRDRNNPSVVGWSIGNELFAIFDLNQVSRDDADRWYRQLGELGERVRKLDPSRPWISCDGDGDLRGTLPVWSRHFGHGTPLDQLPEINKPLMVGESGGTYYARPAQLAIFNGDHAFESYAGRNEALAIDVYDNIVRMARPKLAYYSASETAWFGLEHLNLGYRDFARLPGPQDGIFFTRPFEEGKPGMQPERLPPYVTTLNPGWDAGLPLYKPLAMFHAQKAALAKDGPDPSPWYRRVPTPVQKPQATAAPAFDRATFIGDANNPPANRLRRAGVELGAQARPESTAEFAIIDGDALDPARLTAARASINRIERNGGVALISLGAGKVSAGDLASLLPAAARLTDHPATALIADPAHLPAAGFTLRDLYFAEDGADRFILRHGLEGPLVESGIVLLRASGTDWSLFNNAPEYAKCAALVLHENLFKPGSAALVERGHGKGKIILCTIDPRIGTKAVNDLWRRMLESMGLGLKAMGADVVEAFDEEGALVNALAIGRFGGTDVDSALAADPIGQATARPRPGQAQAGRAWALVNAPSKDRFILRELKQDGPQDAFAVYFSFWIKSSRSLDDLLADGPDAPKFDMFCYVFEKSRLFLNGREVVPSQAEPADYRTRLAYNGLPLKKGWNHMMIKVASSRLDGDRPGTLAVRIRSSNPEYLRQVETAVQPEGE